METHHYLDWIFTIYWYIGTFLGVLALIDAFREPQDYPVAITAGVILLGMLVAWSFLVNHPHKSLPVVVTGFRVLGSVGIGLLLAGYVIGIVFLAVTIIPVLEQDWQKEIIPGNPGKASQPFLTKNFVSVALVPSYVIAWEFSLKYYSSVLAWVILAAGAIIALLEGYLSHGFKSTTQEPRGNSSDTKRPQESKYLKQELKLIFLFLWLGMTTVVLSELFFEVAGFSPLQGYGLTTLLFLLGFLGFFILISLLEFRFQESKNRYIVQAFFLALTSAWLIAAWPTHLVDTLLGYLVGIFAAGGGIWVTWIFAREIKKSIEMKPRLTSIVVGVFALVVIIIAGLILLNNASPRVFGLVATGVMGSALFLVSTILLKAAGRPERNEREVND